MLRDSRVPIRDNLKAPSDTKSGLIIRDAMNYGILNGMYFGLFGSEIYLNRQIPEGDYAQS